MTPSQRTLVIGLGSTLRGDDALGRIAAEQLRQRVDPRRVRVIDQIAPTPELAAEVANASLAIFLDASVDGPPEQILTRRLEAGAADTASAHQLSAPDVLALARRLYNRAAQAYAITFRAHTLDFADHRLSPAAEQACEAIVVETLAIINRFSQTSTQDTHEHPRA